MAKLIKQMIGRADEIETLSGFKSGDKSVFAAIYGRRRVGKTFLVRNVFSNDFDFTLTGIANANMGQQLANFHYAMAQYAPKQIYTAPKTWQEAFRQLMDHLGQPGKKKKLIFIDELPWLDTAQSGFFSALEHFWNAWASGRNDIVLIVCGSAASWMINKLINDKGGLHNRVTHRLRIDPFTLQETEAFFKSKSAVYDRYQLLQLYMVMGGIPFYLEQVDIQKSAAQNINRLCFQPKGMLRTEFLNLYHSLFQNPEKHIRLIECLGKKTKGLTRDELIAASGLTGGGSLTRMLTELTESGFIRKYQFFGGKEKHSLYQLSDCYSLFYLKMISGQNIMDENHWISGLDSSAQRAWGGYAFEQVCLAHLVQIKKRLGISGVQTQTSSWISRGTEKGKGTQIDLLIDRRDFVVNVCEMKFSINEFTIDKKYAADIRNKLENFRIESKTKKALFFTMITTFGVKANEYKGSLVQNELTMDDLFD